MNCEFAEKVSMLIDGELAESESQKVLAHIADCTECREMQEDFLFFRKQIKETAASFNIAEQAQVQTLLPAAPHKWWEKGISIPVPILALILLMLGVFGVWVWLSDFHRDKEFAVNTPVKPAVTAPAKAEQGLNEMSLARFDTGGRAEIYIAPATAKKADQ